MNRKEIIESLYGFSEGTYYNWKKEQRLILQLIDKYFSEDEVVEFIKTGKIKKFDMFRNLSKEEVEDMSASKDLLPLLDDFAHYSLNKKLIDFFKIFNISDITKYPLKKMLASIINDVKIDGSFNRQNAKELLIISLKTYLKKVDGFDMLENNFDERYLTYLENLINFINNEFSKIEAFLLIRDFNRYENIF